MRSHGIMLLLVLGLGSCLWGADPFAGTWKLNPAKSKVVAGQPLPQELTMVIVQQGGECMATEKGIRANGKPLSEKYSLQCDGGPVTFTEGGPPAGTTVVAKKINEVTVEFTTSENGTVTLTDRGVLSSDRKTLTITRKGTVQGRPIDRFEVYDRKE